MMASCSQKFHRYMKSLMRSHFDKIFTITYESRTSHFIDISSSSSEDDPFISIPASLRTRPLVPINLCGMDLQVCMPTRIHPLEIQCNRIGELTTTKSEALLNQTLVAFTNSLMTKDVLMQSMMKSFPNIMCGNGCVSLRKESSRTKRKCCLLKHAIKNKEEQLTHIRCGKCDIVLLNNYGRHVFVRISNNIGELTTTKSEALLNQTLVAFTNSLMTKDVLMQSMMKSFPNIMCGNGCASLRKESSRTKRSTRLWKWTKDISNGSLDGRFNKA
ncbi:hypothetical protein GCK72_000682 [Caenorhabditis remanei]|uniref:Uncharacterized protein n=1 Tax=Caenorhabditis remanei TaxID=31234 RepID=A0A6A5HMM1_CAERE|nr:hypothetical protein GCK72_000682 [Caenorhabditis remanei]KAF1768869.1 hypothetical protein GCK72_000682 [Caenorhabditis remanei]